MAYRLNSAPQKVNFEDPLLDEMEVFVDTQLPLSVFFDLQLQMGSQDPKQMRDACLLFGEKVLVTWDVQDDSGNDIEPSGKGFMTLPMSLAMEILGAWANEAGKAGKVQGISQNGISQSAVELTPMAT
jgi:hypothetical protein